MSRGFPFEMSHQIAIVLKSCDSCVILSTNKKLPHELKLSEKVSEKLNFWFGKNLESET